MSKEKIEGVSYRDLVKDKLFVPGPGDYLHYDSEGKLWLNNNLEIEKAVKEFGAPLLIVDTNIIIRRTNEWRELCQKVARETGYQGGFELCYAAKANPSSAVVAATERAGCSHETSSFHDLLNHLALIYNSLIKKNSLIVCNGFKLPPKVDNYLEKPLEKDEVIFDHLHPTKTRVNDSYAELIIRMAREDYNVLPVFDSGEVEYFAENAPSMKVGLRLHFGKVTTEKELEQWDSRFGMSWEELWETAEDIKQTPNLNLVMLHTMVGAAETISIKKLIAAYSLATEKYFALRKIHPNLQYLNIGGGMAPKSERDYDFQGFLSQLFQMIKTKAGSYNLPEPTIIFEYGSHFVSEAGVYVFQIIQEKSNSRWPDGKDKSWAIVEGGLMASLPDMFILNKKFTVLAANYATYPPKTVSLGDISCDNDGKLNEDILIPDIAPDKSQMPKIIAIIGVGNYQDILGGVGGANHCLIEEATLIIVETRKDGLIYARKKSALEREATRVSIGYGPEDYLYLKMAR